MELRSCYFCGSTGRTLETRELVPARPATDRPAPDADRASVILCPDCDAKLDRVLDRVLDTNRDRTDAAVAPPTTGETAADAGDAGFSTEITFDDAASGVGTADASDPDAGDADDAHAADGSADAPRTGSGARAGVDVVGGPETTDGDGAATDGPDDADREGDGDSGEDAAVVGGTVEGDEADDDGGSSGELRSLGESSAGTYRKALRLLQNREFPMARTDLVDVLSSAYDLDHGECERLVDFAVERGWLVADGDELRRE